MHTKHINQIRANLHQFEGNESTEFIVKIMAGYCYLRLITFAEHMNMKYRLNISHDDIMGLHDDFMDMINGEGKYDFKINESLL